jgi:arylesterase/paraoxonase
MKVRRLFWLLLAAGLSVLAFKAIRDLRPFVKTTPLGVEGCRLLHAEGLVGAEDMEFDHATGMLYIAAANRRSSGTGRPDPGAIFAWHPDEEATPIKLPLQGIGEALRPHGLGLYVHPSGERRLFVVHHSPRGEAVVIFRIDSSGAAAGPLSGRKQLLMQIRSVQAPQFVSPNDVAGVGLESFYLTNDHGRRYGLGHVFEDFALQSNASLLYFDGTSVRTVASGLRYANGVQLSADRRHVLVAESSAYRIKTFRRDEAGNLTLLTETPLDTTPDNFSLDEQGNFLVAAHPSPYLFLRHATSAKQHAPSDVLRFSLSAEGSPHAFQTLLRDPGERLSASSIAVAHGRHLVIGGVFDRGVLYCPRN